MLMPLAFCPPVGKRYALTPHGKDNLRQIHRILQQRERKKIDPTWLKSLVSATRAAMQNCDQHYATHLNQLTSFIALTHIETINPAQMVAFFHEITRFINHVNDIFDALSRINNTTYRNELKNIIHELVVVLNDTRCMLHQHIPSELLETL